MRIIRFVDDDGRILIGDDLGGDRARVLIDTRGVVDHEHRGSMRAVLQGKRALVADDDPSMREIVSTVLTRVGCTCTVCADGEEAMKAIEGEAIDLVVSDILMPHHDGYEIFSAAKQRRGDMPVLLITGFGYDPSHSLVRAAKEGHESVLYKPFTPQQLLEELSVALNTANGTGVRGIVPAPQELHISRRLAPVLPHDVICIGRNYGSGPTDEAIRREPMEVFLKPTSAVVGPDEPIRVPAFDDDVDIHIDCEGELAMVIGSTAENVAPEDAMDYVLGFTCANDVTARRFQTPSGPPQWMRGKGFNSFCPLGPAIVPTRELPDLHDAVIRTLVNGEVVREAPVEHMLRTPAEIVSELSRHLTLPPGCVVLTGAPPRHPRSVTGRDHLLAGDEVTVEIDSIGRLSSVISS